MEQNEVSETITRFRPTGQDYKLNGATKRVHGYELVMGLIDTMMDVTRTPEANLLKEVLRQAVMDMADNLPDSDPLYAYDFLFGKEGRLYCDALGIDCEMVRDQIIRKMPGEMARIITLRAEAEKAEVARCKLANIESDFLDALMEKPLSVKDIQRKLEVTSSTVRRLVKRMRQLGYVEIAEGLQPSKLVAADTVAISKTRKAA